MGWFKKIYRKKEKWKPKFWKKVEPAIPLVLGVTAGPLVGAIGQALHTLRKSTEAEWDAMDAAERERMISDTPGIVDPTPIDPASPSIPFIGSDSYNFANLGGIPAMYFTQLGGGLSQQTAAVRVNAAKAAGRKGGLRSAKRRKAKKKAAAPRARRMKRVTKGNGRLKKGSAAAKAWGKKMKRLRKG